MPITLLQPCLTLQDIELILGDDEVIAISDLCDPLNTAVNAPKLQFFLDMSLETLNSYYVSGTDCTRAFIKLNCRRILLAIFRYTADLTKSRPFLEQEYLRVIQELKDCGCGKCPLSDSDIKQILGEDATATNAKYRGTRGYGCGCGLYFPRPGLIEEG